MNRPALVLIGSALMVLCSACQPRPAAPPPSSSQMEPRTPQVLEHTIRYSGETVAAIAAWYTGKATNWTLIRDANPGLRPERLRLGQLVMIPTSILSRSEPMPKEFLKKFVAGTPSKGGKGDVVAPENSGAKAEDSKGPADSAVSDSATPAPSEGSPAPAEEAPKAEATPVVAETPAPAIEAPTPEPAKEAPAAATTPADAEREKLLDDLLSNP